MPEAMNLNLILIGVIISSWYIRRSTCFGPENFIRSLSLSRVGNTAVKKNENGLDEEYPWCFSGRLWFRPALVRDPTLSAVSPRPPPSVSVLSLFGWTIGGVVALEYDDSPVGPYREYVTMGAVVSKRGALGQWGSKLYVSTIEAEDVCKDVWNVPAELADIDFRDGNDTIMELDKNEVQLSVPSAPTTASTKKREKIEVNGWYNTRVVSRGNKEKEENTPKRYPSGGLPVLWTPSIKALWAPFVPFPQPSNADSNLPLHRLRLSASGIQVKFCGQKPTDLLGISFPVGLVVDNVLIEISRKKGNL